MVTIGYDLQSRDQGAGWEPVSKPLDGAAPRAVPWLPRLQPGTPTDMTHKFVAIPRACATGRLTGDRVELGTDSDRRLDRATGPDDGWCTHGSASVDAVPLDGEVTTWCLTPHGHAGVCRAGGAGDPGTSATARGTSH